MSHAHELPEPSLQVDELTLGQPYKDFYASIICPFANCRGDKVSDARLDDGRCNGISVR